MASKHTAEIFFIARANAVFEIFCVAALRLHKARGYQTRLTKAHHFRKVMCLSHGTVVNFISFLESDKTAEL